MFGIFNINNFGVQNFNILKFSNQPVFKVLSLFFCYSHAEIFKSVEFDIKANQTINIFINISNITGINNFSNLIMKFPMTWENNLKIAPSFVRNYTQGEILPPYYLLTNSVDKVTENFSNIYYVNNETLLTSLLYTEGQFKWKYLSIYFYTYSSPSIASDGTIYVGSYDKNLYAINPNGTLKWKYLTDGMIYVSSPSIANDGTIYIGSWDSNLYAVNPNGTLKWKYLTGNFDSSPSIANDGTIYVGSNDKNLYSINPNGSLKWQYKTGDGIASSPAIANDETIYVGSSDKNLYAINFNGSLKWKYLTSGRIFSSPSIANDGTIYVGSEDYNLYSINPNGNLNWKYLTDSYIYSSPSIANDGTIYVGSDDKNLYAINPNGSLKWKYSTAGKISSSPSIAIDGTIYVGSDDKNLYAINPNGSLKWKYLTFGSIYSSPSIARDGTIYVGSYDGSLYAISSKNYFLTSPWPNFAQNNLHNGVQISFANSLQLFDFRFLTINGFLNYTAKVFIDFYENAQILTMYINILSDLSSTSPKKSPSPGVSLSNSLSYLSSPKASIASKSSKNSILEQSVSPYSMSSSPQVSPFSSLNMDNEFKITSNAGSDDTPVITSLSNGNFVIAWAADSRSTDADIYAKIYTISGTSVTEEFKFNNKTLGKQYWPSIASLNNGNFIIAWNGPDASGYGVYGQICTNSGLKVSDEFQINTETFNSQYSTSIATLNNGNFVVVWVSGSSSGFGSEIYGQIYTSIGNKVGSFFQVNSVISTGNQIKHREDPYVAALMNGNFVVVWGDSVKDGDFYGVVAQMFSDIGNKINNEFIVNTFIKNDQRYPSISALSDGNFIVVWQSDDGYYSNPNQGIYNQGIYGQIYSNYGVKQGSEILISSISNSYSTRLQDPKVVGLSNGNFIVAWERREISTGYGILYGQGFTNSGEKVSNEFKINYYSDGSQQKPSLTSFPNGDFMIVWGSNNQNSNKRGIYGKLFKAFPNYKLSFSPNPKDYTSSAYVNKPLLVSFIEKGKDLLKSTKSKMLDVFLNDDSQKSKELFGNDDLINNFLKLKI